MVTKVIGAILDQVKKELGAASAYYDLDMWASYSGYEGFQDFCKNSAPEEMTHARKFLKYVVDYYDTPVVFPGMPGALRTETPTSLSSAVKQVLALELSVTSAIKKLAQLAREEAETETAIWIEKTFLIEQIRSVAQLREFDRLLDLAGDDVAAIMRVDHYIGKNA